MTNYFFCYSVKMFQFLKHVKGFQFICYAKHDKTDKPFWLFERTQELNNALTEYGQVKDKVNV